MSAGTLFAVLDALEAIDDLAPSDRFVLVLIADQMNDRRDGWAWPSANFLARRSGYNERSIRRSIDHLGALGLLEIRRRPGASPMARVVIHNPGHQVRGSDPQPDIDPGHHVRTPRTPCPDPPDTMSDEPIKEPRSEPTAAIIYEPRCIGCDEPCSDNDEHWCNTCRRTG